MRSCLRGAPPATRALTMEVSAFSNSSPVPAFGQEIKSRRYSGRNPVRPGEGPTGKKLKALSRTRREGNRGGGTASPSVGTGGIRGGSGTGCRSRSSAATSAVGGLTPADVKAVTALAKWPSSAKRIARLSGCASPSSDESKEPVEGDESMAGDVLGLRDGVEGFLPK